MICAHLFAHIFIKFEQNNKKNIEKWVGHDLCTSPWFFDTKWENKNIFLKIKERKRKKNREHIKKREKVGNKREGRKIKERKIKIKQGKKSYLSNKLL